MYAIRTTSAARPLRASSILKKASRRSRNALSIRREAALSQARADRGPQRQTRQRSHGIRRPDPPPAKQLARVGRRLGRTAAVRTEWGRTVVVALARHPGRRQPPGVARPAGRRSGDRVARSRCTDVVVGAGDARREKRHTDRSGVGLRSAGRRGTGRAHEPVDRGTEPVYVAWRRRERVDEDRIWGDVTAPGPSSAHATRIGRRGPGRQQGGQRTSGRSLGFKFSD
jgi:hypothetical protein